MSGFFEKVEETNRRKLLLLDFLENFLQGKDSVKQICCGERDNAPIDGETVVQ